jgi:hypothetical protein
MKKIWSFTKKYWFLPLISLAAIAYLANLLIKSPPSTTGTNSGSQKVATYGSIAPGVSTQDQVTTALGKSTGTETINGQTAFQYKSTNQNRFHQVIYNNGTVSLIKEVVNSNDNIKSDYVTNQYGMAPYMLYNDQSNNYFNLYVYPSNGIAYLGHADGTVLEIWYFQPTTLDDFIKNWGTGFSETTPSSSDIGY